MSSPADRRARLLVTIYRAFGEPAVWQPVTGDPVTGIRIRRAAEEDVPVEFGSNSRAVVERIVLRVRVSEVANPVMGSRFDVLDDDGEVIGGYIVADRPLKVRFGLEWRVEVEVAS